MSIFLIYVTFITYNINNNLYLYFILYYFICKKFYYILYIIYKRYHYVYKYLRLSGKKRGETLGGMYSALGPPGQARSRGEPSGSLTKREKKLWSGHRLRRAAWQFCCRR